MMNYRSLAGIAAALFAFGLALPAFPQPTPPAAQAEPERQPEIAGARRRPVDAKHGAEARTYWSPMVESETVRVEFELPPGTTDERLQISVPELSHFVTSTREDFVEKASSTCELDVMCYSGTWQNESDAVARLLFQ